MRHNKSWLNVDQSLNTYLFYEDSLHFIKEGNELLAKEAMAFYKKLSSTVYNTPHISYKNMASFSYNTDDFSLLPSNGTSRQSTSVYIPRSPVFSRKSFVCATSVPTHACFCLVPPTAVRNCKNILNRSIRCNSVRSSSSNFDRVSKLDYPVVSSSDSVTNISKFTPSNSHSVDSSKSSFRVVSHRNIHRKRKLPKSVISLSLSIALTVIFPTNLL